MPKCKTIRHTKSKASKIHHTFLRSCSPLLAILSTCTLFTSAWCHVSIPFANTKSPTNRLIQFPTRGTYTTTFWFGALGCRAAEADMGCNFLLHTLINYVPGLPSREASHRAVVQLLSSISSFVSLINYPLCFSWPWLTILRALHFLDAKGTDIGRGGWYPSADPLGLVSLRFTSLHTFINTMSFPLRVLP